MKEETEDNFAFSAVCSFFLKNLEWPHRVFFGLVGRVLESESEGTHTRDFVALSLLCTNLFLTPTTRVRLSLFSFFLSLFLPFAGTRTQLNSRKLGKRTNVRISPQLLSLTKTI